MLKHLKSVQSLIDIDLSDPINNAHPLAQGLVGFWLPVPQLAGGYTLYDLTQYGNHGTLTNMDPSTDWIVTERGIALDFDGSNDYVTTRKVSDFTSGEHTILIGFYRTRLINYEWLFSEQGNGNNNDEVEIYLADTASATQDKITAVVWRGTSAKSCVSSYAGVNTWTDLAFSFSQVGMMLYVNGDLVDSNSCYLPSTTSDIWYYATRPQLNGYFSGRVGYICHMARILNVSDVRIFRNEYMRGFPSLLNRRRKWWRGVTFKAPRTKSNITIIKRKSVSDSLIDVDLSNPINTSHPLAQGLVGFWLPLLQLSGGYKLYDLTQYRNHGILNNMEPQSDWITVQDGLAVDFDGTDDYITTNLAIDGVGSGDFFWLARVKFRTLPASSYWSCIMGAGSYSPAIYGELKGLGYGMWWGNNYASGVTLSTDTWHTLCFQRRNGTVLFYVDGDVCPNTHTIASTPTGNMHFASSSTTLHEPMDGIGKCYGVWLRSFSDAEIRDLTAETLRSFPSLLNRRRTPIIRKPRYRAGTLHGVTL